ncbi:MAG: VOC family protein [Actinobacteria bacterium]|nr:VOC family protein [Actinomycetota bacterium]
MTTPIEPHLWTADLGPMVAWYRDALGFQVEAWFPDEDAPTWCRMTRGDAALMIAVAPDPDALAPHQGYLAPVADRVAGPGGPLSLYLRVPSADDVYAGATAAGAKVIEDIWDAWWGGRQFTTADPDGNWWTVFQPTGE